MKGEALEKDPVEREVTQRITGKKGKNGVGYTEEREICNRTKHQEMWEKWKRHKEVR